MRWVFLLVMLVAALACRPARNGLYATAGLPRDEPCEPRRFRCNGAVPEVCAREDNGATRWWSTVPPTVSGEPGRCARCVVGDGGVASCAQVERDGGAS